MRRREGWAAGLFLLPFGALFTVFVLAPVLFGLWISLHNWHILADRATFIGLDNYASALADDLFRHSLVRTAFFVAMVVPVGNAVSLLLALVLNGRFRGVTFYKVAFYLPVLLSVTVVALLWRWLYNAEFGLINHYLGRNVPWLGDPAYAMPALALMSIWWGAGGNMLIYLAGLKSVPREMHEAAEIDGANGWVRFWSTTWPWLRPVTLFCVVISIIGSAQVFGQSYIITQGGPADSTLTVILYMYRMGFGQYQLGYASAVAYILFLLVFALALIQFRLLAFRD